MLALGAHQRAVAHAISYRRWRLVTWSLTGIVAVCSGLAGASLLAQAKPGTLFSVAVGILGLVGAAGAAIVATLGPQASAEGQKRAHDGFLALRADYLR